MVVVVGICFRDGDKNGIENQVVDHFSKLKNHEHVEDRGKIKEAFHD